MKGPEFDRRKFIKGSATVAGMTLLSGLSAETASAYEHLPNKTTFWGPEVPVIKPIAPRLKFSVIGINHSHINAMVDAVIRGGGEFVSFYAKEPELTGPF